MKSIKLPFIFLFILLYSCGGGEEKQETQTQTNSSQNEITEDESPQTDKKAPPVKEKEDTKATKMQAVIQDYCQFFNEKEFYAVSDLFTPKVEQWITLKNIKNSTIGEEAAKFLGTKLNVHYRPDFIKMKREGQTAYLPIAMSWEGYFAEVEAEIKFDEDFKITSYRENKILKTKGNIAGGGTFASLLAKFPPVDDVSKLSNTDVGENSPQVNLKDLQYLFKVMDSDIFYASGISTFHPAGSYQSGGYTLLVLKELTEEDMAPAGPPTNAYLFIFDKEGKLTYSKNIGFNYPGAAMARSYTEAAFKESGKDLIVEITDAYSSYYEDLNEGQIIKHRLNKQGKLEKMGVQTFSRTFMEGAN